ncbi:formate dehydrogenase subunit gamma [Oxalobacteraceae bacterium OM1]|nr:formate dehydrogenase subunit gamma [Oxalobacteraceae bacterium OM1]
MKTWITTLALGLSLATGAALAQNAPQPAPAAAPGAPNVESVDILKQNQAERSLVQPGNNAPTWRIVKEGTNNYSSLPAREAGVLIQARTQFPGQDHATTAGEAWRRYRNGPLTNYGGWLLILALAAVAALYFVKGPIKTHAPATGRLIERFTALERLTHWSVAISFLVLAVSGLTMLFGKHVLMPVLGHTLFGWLTYALKTVHNFVGPLFLVSTLVFFVLYVKDNIPSLVDVKWLARLGGAVGKEHPSSYRFNGGEKVWFWGGLTLLGLVVSASGFVLDMIVPGIDYTRGNMQVANIIHLIGAVLFMGGAIGHIYIGTVGTEGAYEGMRTGYVDDAWAREHHDLWYAQVERGEIPRVRSQDAAAAPVQPKTV